MIILTEPVAIPDQWFAGAGYASSIVLTGVGWLKGKNSRNCISLTRNNPYLYNLSAREA